jgi:low affinity Fe/Cu permease
MRCTNSTPLFFITYPPSVMDYEILIRISKRIIRCIPNKVITIKKNTKLEGTKSSEWYHISIGDDIKLRGITIQEVKEKLLNYERNNCDTSIE